MKKINLVRLWDKFIVLVLAYMKENDLTQGQLAKIVGMQRTHINALLNRYHKRPLSGYYLLKFISKGIITVKQIYDSEEETEREEDFWNQAKEAENYKLLAKIARIRKSGTDIDKFLEIHFPNV